MKKLLLGTIVTATFAAAAVPLAFADRDGDRGEHYGRHAHMQQDGKRALPSQRVEERLTRLKSELKITEAQEPQWNAYADAMRRHAKDADQRMEQFRAMRTEGRERAQMNAVERLERRQAHMAEMSARMADTLAVLKPLYAALSPEQQKAFDEQRGPRRGHGEHHRHGHGEHERGERAAS